VGNYFNKTTQAKIFDGLGELHMSSSVPRLPSTHLHGPLVSLNGVQYRFQPYDPVTQGPAAGTTAVLFTVPMSTTVVILRPTAADFFATIATMRSQIDLLVHYGTVGRNADVSFRGSRFTVSGVDIQGNVLLTPRTAIATIWGVATTTVRLADLLEITPYVAPVAAAPTPVMSTQTVNVVQTRDTHRTPDGSLRLKETYDSCMTIPDHEYARLGAQAEGVTAFPEDLNGIQYMATPNFVAYTFVRDPTPSDEVAALYTPSFTTLSSSRNFLARSCATRTSLGRTTRCRTRSFT